MDKAHDAFRTISEVAKELGVPKHVLRFWESKFPHIKPMKRGGGRRYYRPEDMQLLSGIRRLLHADGYTIKGVQKILREQGVEAVKKAGEVAQDKSAPARRAPVSKKVTSKQSKPKVAAKNSNHDHQPVPAKRHGSINSHARIAQFDDLIHELQACRTLLVGKRAQPVRKSATGRKSRTVRSA